MLSKQSSEVAGFQLCRRQGPRRLPRQGPVRADFVGGTAGEPRARCDDYAGKSELSEPGVGGRRARLIPPRRRGLPTIYQAAFWPTRDGLKVVPALSMAQATLSRRSATDRSARA